MSPICYETIPVKDVPLTDTITIAGQQRVLVVDDEQVIADTLSVILSRSGFVTLTAYDGDQALELAREARPDLLLSDVMMGPGIDGTELAMEIVGSYPDCKVLLFSGHAATRDLLEKARDAGHNFTLLNKPVHPADLLSQIREIFATQAAA